MIEGDSIGNISDIGMRRWFRDSTTLIINWNRTTPNRYKILGMYDPVYKEYVVSLRDSETSGVYDTVAFSTIANEGRGAWVSFYDYDPQWFISNKKRMYIGYIQNIYTPFYAIPGRLMGSYKDSTVEIVSNIEPDSIKNYFAIDLDANKAPNSVTIETLKGQASSLLSADFVEREGRWESPILRDSNTPDISQPLLYGDTIKSTTAKFKFTFANAPSSGVKINRVSFVVSRA
jgi:hypothetical protein